MFNFYFKSDLSAIDRETLFGIIFAVVLYTAVMAAVCLALYILRAIGIYKMSKTAGVEYPWLSFIPVILSSFLLMLSALAFAIVKYIALWRVYSSFDGKNAVLFTVLSVLFNFLEPVFLFVIRNNQPNFAPLGIYNPDNYEQ